MTDVKKYVQLLFDNFKITVAQNQAGLFQDFAEHKATVDAVQEILDNQQKIMNRWKIKSRVDDVLNQHFSIPNGTVNKPYESAIDVAKLQWDDVTIAAVDALDAIGLQYDAATFKIAGTPTASGDLKFNIRFTLSADDTKTEYNKQVTIIINPDPRSLWKNIPAPADDKYRKEDRVAFFDKLGDRHIVAASSRGRSHANVGSFREDDVAYQQLANGWCVVAVADGAGSAKLSRHGSSVACHSVMEFFKQSLEGENDAAFDALLTTFYTAATPENKAAIDHWGTALLKKAACYAHDQLKSAAIKAEAELKHLNTTLIFVLFKKIESGYVFFSFGVGDCPIAILNKNHTEVTMMNWLDVGEFGGGTRFVTMPEVFSDEKFSSRLGFRMVDDFSFLFLMSDGIYDAKFVVEANLEKAGKWADFLADLRGKNEENINIIFSTEEAGIAEKLSAWMEFWSVGNHDDRTLAIVF